MKHLVPGKTQNMMFHKDLFLMHCYSIYIYLTFFTSLKIQILQVMQITLQYVQYVKENKESVVNTTHLAQQKNTLIGLNLEYLISLEATFYAEYHIKSPRTSALGKKFYNIFTAEHFFSIIGKFVSLTNKSLRHTKLNSYFVLS